MFADLVVDLLVARVGLGAEAEYEMLFTNRLIGQWLVEGEAWSKDDPTVGIGSGLSKVEAGFRLRYEFHRQFAPYVGVEWSRELGDTADRNAAEAARGTQDVSENVARVRASADETGGAAEQVRAGKTRVSRSTVSRIAHAWV